MRRDRIRRCPASGLSGANLLEHCLWQDSQSPLIFDPSLASCESSWQRKQPFDVTWPLLFG